MSLSITKRLLTSVLFVQGVLIFGLCPNAFAYVDIPKHVPNGFYISGGIGENEFSTSQMTGFTIVSDKKVERAINKTSISELKFLYLLAAGYADDNWPIRGEFQYFKTGDLDYRMSTAFSDGAFPQLVNLHSKISSQALFVNGYFDSMGSYSNFMPYFLLGVGFASNRAKWTTGYKLSPAPPPTLLSGSEKKSTFAWQVGFGSRIRMTDNFFADIGIRYLSLGKLEWEMADTGIKAKELNSIQVDLSLTWFLGDQSRPPPSLINDDVE